MKKRGPVKRSPRPSRWDTGLTGLDDHDVYVRAAAIIKVVANPLRLRLLVTLDHDQPARPVDLCVAIGGMVSPFVVYNAINILKRAGLVIGQGKVGQAPYYVVTKHGQEVIKIIRATIDMNQRS